MYGIVLGEDQRRAAIPNAPFPMPCNAAVAAIQSMNLCAAGMNLGARAGAEISANLSEKHRAPTHPTP